MDAMDPALVDSALAGLPRWRHAGEFLVRHISIQDGEKATLEQAVHSVEGAPDRCTFTDTAGGVMIYLGDLAGEGIAEEDFKTAQRIDSALATV